MVALLGLPLAVLPAAPALAANTFVCEDVAPWCIGAPNLALYSPLIETTSGRNLTVSPLRDGTYIISIDAVPGECVAAANNGMDVVIHPCGGAGVHWYAQTDPSGPAFRLISQEFPNKYLVGPGVGGAAFQLRVAGAWNCCYRFDLDGRPS
jgi:hypothetical protein